MLNSYIIHFSEIHYSQEVRENHLNSWHLLGFYRRKVKDE